MESEDILMSRSRLLDYDPVTKVRRMFHDSDDGNSFVEEVTQDVTDRVEVNKEIYNAGWSGWGDGQRVASIPIEIAEDLQRRGIWNDTKKLKAWLNDSENSAWRTRPGRV
jgi:hypothetical protein